MKTVPSNVGKMCIFCFVLVEVRDGKTSKEEVRAKFLIYQL